jgi:hypothetical protein
VIEVSGLGEAVAFRALPVALSHVNMDDYDLWITHHYIPFLSIMRQCMLPWKKNACCRESHLSYLSITLLPYNHTIHVCTTFYWGQDFLTCVFYERPRGVLWHHFSQLREAAVNFSSPPHCRCSLDFLDMCGTIKIFFLLLWFFRYVHFASSHKNTRKKDGKFVGRKKFGNKFEKYRHKYFVKNIWNNFLKNLEQNFRHKLSK